MKETGFFRTYYKTIRLTATFVLLVALGLSALQFYRGLEHEFTLIKRQFQKSNADLELIIEACVEHVKAMRIRAEDYLNMPHLEGEQPLYHYLSNHSSGSYYHLDSLPTYSAIDFTGNLTGKGNLDSLSRSKQRELRMALSLNHLFKATVRNIPNVAWVYYTSEDFIHIYPHVHSSSFKYTEELYYHDFYQHALPENNPRGQLFWTTAYIDEAGKGLMVSCADPVYEGSSFKGSVAIDLTLDSLHGIISKAQREYGSLFIINQSEQVLAHPSVSASDTNITKLADVLPKGIYEEIGDFSGWEDASPHKIGSYYVYFESIPDTPWKMVYVVSTTTTYLSVFAEIGFALLFLLFSIGFILFVGNRSIEKQFIQPAQQLVQHLQAEHNNLPTSAREDLPEAWKGWFKMISKTFRENRDLFYQLERQNQSLEHLVDERTKELVEKNEELRASEEELKSMNEQLTHANTTISANNQKITDSITYARRIQRGIIPSPDGLQELFPESFCLFMPRDIVSGDFYWYAQIDHLKIATVADCTGHGVPGAFMSMLGITVLEDIIQDRGIHTPEKVLDAMRSRITGIFRKKGQDTPKDGLNISICIIDQEQKEVAFAGAYHPLFIVRNNVHLLTNQPESVLENEAHQLLQIKGDKQPIGHFEKKKQAFTCHKFPYQLGDKLYMYSDGYVDQFGGADNRKFMTRRFKQLILDIQQLDMQQQRRELKLTMRHWMGEEEQIDDICVMGIELT